MSLPLNNISTLEPKSQHGFSVPLFEKLWDEDYTIQSEFPIKKFFQHKEYLDSIKLNIKRIMSTQAKAKKATYLALCKNPLNFGLPEMYGVPEFTYYDATNIYDWPKINKLLSKIIMHYEPRLQNVVVSIKEFSKQKQSLMTQILAKVVMPSYMEEVTFLLETSLNDLG